MKVAQYSSGAKFLHWLIGIIVIVMLSCSFFLNDLPDKYQSSAYMIHKSLGLTVLFLVMLFFLWIKRTGKPAWPNTMSPWQKILAYTVHYSLFVLLIIMPLCGWIMSVAANRVPSYFGLFKMPLPIKESESLAEFMEQSHIVIAWLLIALIVLHIAGALVHHFIEKDNILKQMLPKHCSKT